MKTIELVLLIAPWFLILALYAHTALMLRWYLEANHNEFVERAGFPKKMSGSMYYSTPRTGGNWIKFVFSGNHLDDPAVKRLKVKTRTVIVVAGIWAISFVIYCLRQS